MTTPLKSACRFLCLSLVIAVFACSPPANKPAGQQGAPSATSPAKPLEVPFFDGAGAMKLLEEQVAFGPRKFGTTAHDQCRAWLVAELRVSMDRVEEQTFTEKTYEGGTMQLTNIVASFDPDRTNRVLLCAHWDSRPRADQEKPPVDSAIPAANDGASGVAVLLQIARHLKAGKPAMGVDIVLFDGEDYGTGGDLERYCLGARYFAKHTPSWFHAQEGILLDMVGDRDAVFAKEPASLFYARDVVNLVWAAAQQARAAQFSSQQSGEIFDDHVPLNEAGIRTIDIIDASLIGNQDPNPRRRYWHTRNDTPENCSAETLHAVGQTLLQFLYTPRAAQ